MNSTDGPPLTIREAVTAGRVDRRTGTLETDHRDRTGGLVVGRFCSHCGAPLEEGARFCPECGQAVSGGGSTNAGAPAAAAGPVPQAPSPARGTRRRNWIGDALLLIVVATLVGAGTALVLNALDTTNGTLTSSQLESRNAAAKPGVAYANVSALAAAGGIDCKNATTGVVSSATGLIGTTQFCSDPVVPLDLAVLAPGVGPPQTCDFWKKLATDAADLDQAIRKDKGPASLGRLLLTGPNWVIRSNLLGKTELERLQDDIGGHLFNLQLLQDSPPVPKGC